MAVCKWGMLRLNDTDSIGNIQGIVVFAESHVALLQASRSDQSVDLFTFNVVKLFYCRLDLSLVCLDIHNEDKSVAILNQLHGRLGGQGVLDNGMIVDGILFGCALVLVLGLSREL